MLGLKSVGKNSAAIALACACIAMVCPAFAEKPVTQPVKANDATPKKERLIVQYCKALGKSAKDVPVVKAPKSACHVAHHKKHHHSSSSSSSDKCRRKSCCDTATPITSKEINHSGYGYFISAPGEYCLSEDVVFHPKTEGLSAIVINLPPDSCEGAVVLNLNNKTLSQCNAMPFTFGILIAGQANVTIKGGTIKSFTGNGIRVNSGSDGLIFDGLQIVQCGSDALDAESGAVVMLNSNNIQVLRSTFLENIGPGVTGVGTSDVIIDSCNIENSQAGTNTVFGPGSSATGIAFVGSFFIPAATSSPSNIVIKNTTVQKMRAENLCQGIAVANFAPPDPQNILIENCTVQDLVSEGNTVPSAETSGIGVFANNAVIKNCTVSVLSNLVADSADAHGIEVDGSDILVENCVVSNILGNSDPSGNGFVAGFNAENIMTLISGISPQNITYKNCKASNIVNQSSDKAYGFGAQTTTIGVPLQSIGFVYDSCIAESVFGSGGTRAAGFYLTGQQDLTVVNCISNDNNIGFNFEDEPFGALSSIGIIQNNIAEGNAVYGFRDVTNANFAYTGNFARSNGSPGDNYFGTIFPPSTCPPTIGTPGTPMRLWVVPNAPCSVNNNNISGDKLDNIDIR